MIMTMASCVGMPCAKCGAQDLHCRVGTSCAQRALWRSRHKVVQWPGRKQGKRKSNWRTGNLE